MWGVGICWFPWQPSSPYPRSSARRITILGSRSAADNREQQIVPMHNESFMGYFIACENPTPPSWFREVQRISRGDNCVICVEICEISRETWVSSWLMIYLRWSGGWKGYLIFLYPWIHSEQRKLFIITCNIDLSKKSQKTQKFKDTFQHFIVLAPY